MPVKLSKTVVLNPGVSINIQGGASPYDR